jgi:hypothetical protein
VTSIHPLAEVMDSHGMLPQEHFFCLGCGKTLNADGGHPAELYAGTWNGLCYGCTRRGPFVVKVSNLDGARIVSWPPHSPSWRREREKHTAYEDCETCGGLGIEKPVYRSPERAGQYCRPCIRRYSEHPLRVWDDQRRTLLRTRAQAAFERHWDFAAGVPKRCSEKKRRALRQEYADLFDEDGWRAFKAPFLARYKRLAARHTAKATRLGLNAWTEPAAELARGEAAVQRRHADVQARRAAGGGETR